jgi:hypothetical protein
MQIGIFDSERKEKRVHLTSLNDIYKYADEIGQVLAFYEKENVG